MALVLSNANPPTSRIQGGESQGDVVTVESGAMDAWPSGLKDQMCSW